MHPHNKVSNSVCSHFFPRVSGLFLNIMLHISLILSQIPYIARTPYV